MSDIQRWIQCRSCGMVKDTPGRAHNEYGKYDDQGPYYVTYADHVAALQAERERILAGLKSLHRGHDGLASFWYEEAVLKVIGSE